MLDNLVYYILNSQIGAINKDRILRPNQRRRLSTFILLIPLCYVNSYFLLVYILVGVDL